MLAFLISPWVVPLVFVVAALFVPDNPQSFRAVPFTLVIVAPISLGIAYIAEIFFWILVWLVFEHFRIRSLAAYAALGTLVGILVFVAIAIPLDRGSNKVLSLANPILYLCAAAGALSSTLFHIILFFRFR